MASRKRKWYSNARFNAQVSLTLVMTTVLLTPLRADSEEMINPSFACDDDISRIERKICDDPRLSRLDSKMAKIYARLMKYEDEEWIDALQKIQRTWLEARNSMEDDSAIYLRMRYDRQVQRLTMLDRQINPDRYRYARDSDAPERLERSAVQNIYFYTIRKSLHGPWKIEELYDGLYMFEAGSVQVSSGYRLYFENGGEVEKITGPNPSIRHRPTEWAPYFIFSVTGIDGGVMSSAFSMLSVDLETRTTRSQRLLSYQDDGESGGCRRAEAIGLETATSLVDMKVERTKHGSLIEFRTREQNCATRKIKAKKYLYVIEGKDVVNQVQVTVKPGSNE